MKTVECTVPTTGARKSNFRDGSPRIGNVNDKTAKKAIEKVIAIIQTLVSRVGDALGTPLTQQSEVESQYRRMIRT